MYYFYFDASALVKRYTQEIGSEKINFLFSNVPLNRMMCLIHGVTELFWICVRKKNDGRITNLDFSQAGINFNYEIIGIHSDFKTISTPDTLVLNSMSLIETYWYVHSNFVA